MTETVEATIVGEKLPLEQYVGKRVKMTYKNESGDTVEAVATVEVVNDLAVLIRPRGKTTSLMVFEPDQNVLDYGLDDSKPVALKQRELKDTTLNTVRTHLADRHGIPLSQVNEMDEEAAAELHLKLGHGDLSHTHPFISDAEDEADGEEPDEDNLDDDDDNESDDE
jgi:hypothetical protein